MWKVDDLAKKKSKKTRLECRFMAVRVVAVFRMYRAHAQNGLETWVQSETSVEFYPEQGRDMKAVELLTWAEEPRAEEGEDKRVRCSLHVSCQLENA